MKIHKKQLVPFLFLALFSSIAFAEGPPLTQLQPIDESRYDLNNKVLVERSKVYYPISKDFFDRDVYSVRERPEAPKTAYIVREKQVVTRPEERDVYVVVTPQNSANWLYKTK
jgi:hypothetical protein